MYNYFELFKKINEIILNRYILFKEKNINWNEISEKYSELFVNAKNSEDFINLINEMLSSELKDPHVIFKNIGNIPKYFLPVTFKFFENRLISITDNIEIPKGAEILEVDNCKMVRTSIFSEENSSAKMRFLDNIYGSLKEESIYKYLWQGKILNVKLKNILLEPQEKNLVETKNFISSKIFTGLFNKKIDDQTEYIKITMFNHGIFEALFEKIQKFGAKKKLIIDLRGSHGGYVKETIGTVALFLDTEVYLGKKTNNVNGTETTEKVVIKPIKNNSNFDKILILIDNFTMSSAEFIFLRAISKGLDKKNKF